MSHPAQSISRRISRTGETLNLIRSMRQATITDIASRMNVARSTAVERIERLTEAGFLQQVATTAVGRGRPATAYQLNPNAGAVLTAHVGITGFRVGVANLAAEILTHEIIEFDLSQGPRALTKSLINEFEALLDRHQSRFPKVRGIGIGLPGETELAAVSYPATVWESHTLQEELTSYFGTPTHIGHDVNLLALGEQFARDESTGILLCVKVGTVIGCGVAVNGRVIDGADRLAGEIGHTRLVGYDELCGCGNRGCLNAVAGGGALVEQLRNQGLAVRHTRDVVRLANEKSPEARSAIREAGRNIGVVLAGCVNLLNPNTIALWGYLLDAEETLIAGIKEMLIANANPAATRSLRIVSTEAGAVTGLRGAAQLVVERALSPDVIDAEFDPARNN